MSDNLSEQLWNDQLDRMANSHNKPSDTHDVRDAHEKLRFTREAIQAAPGSAISCAMEAVPTRPTAKSTPGDTPDVREAVLSAIDQFVRGWTIVRGDRVGDGVDWKEPHNHAIALVLMQLQDPHETGEMLAAIDKAYASLRSQLEAAQRERDEVVNDYQDLGREMAALLDREKSLMERAEHAERQLAEARKALEQEARAFTALVKLTQPPLTDKEIAQGQEIASRFGLLTEELEALK